MTINNENKNRKGAMKMKFMKEYEEKMLWVSDYQFIEMMKDSDQEYLLAEKLFNEWHLVVGKKTKEPVRIFKTKDGEIALEGEPVTSRGRQLLTEYDYDMPGMLDTLFTDGYLFVPIEKAKNFEPVFMTTYEESELIWPVEYMESGGFVDVEEIEDYIDHGGSRKSLPDSTKNLKRDLDQGNNYLYEIDDFIESIKELIEEAEEEKYDKWEDEVKELGWTLDQAKEAKENGEKFVLDSAGSEWQTYFD